MDELVIKAAQNNADWCDVVCRTHEIPGKFLENIWVNRHVIPAFYPNVVIIKPLSSKTISNISKTLKKFH